MNNINEQNILCQLKKCHVFLSFYSKIKVCQTILTYSFKNYGRKKFSLDFRLQKIDQIRSYFLKEIKKRDLMSMKQKKLLWF